MSKPGWPTTIPPGTERDTLVALVRDAHTILNGGVTIADNMLAAYTQLIVLDDGVEVLLPNPLKGGVKPIDITAVYAEADGSATFPPILRWYVTTSGLISITPQYVTTPSGSAPSVRLRLHAG